ncbi:hypothetical protein [Dickeya zeae]|uniref:hypothetical protein n=1 Tax=Dickeya zeae TaxID=204042 RepID=UPI0003C7DF50|nr:hypothetical protein [Dickeya zeae]
MKFIKLTQCSSAWHQGEYGPEEKVVYESIYVSVDHIESFCPTGLTHLQMSSGERIRVKETPDEILVLAAQNASDAEVKFWTELGDKK